MNKLSIWLSAIILLTITAFLVVFKPITFEPRKDPSDASKYLTTIEPSKDWDASMPPKEFTSFGERLKVYVYKPQHDLRLGLDLRGGMRVVLKVPNRAEFTYTLTPKLRTAAAAADRQQRLVEALAQPDALGEVAHDGKSVSVIVNEQQAKIVTLPRSLEESKAQLERVNAAMAAVFDAGTYETPDADDAFKPVDAETQKTVMKIMENRLNSSGLSEVSSYAKGTNEIVLEIPGVKDVDTVLRRLGTTAQMEFRLLPTDVMVSKDEKDNTVLLKGGVPVDEQQSVIEASYLVVRGSALEPNSRPVPDNTGKPAVSFSMASQADRAQFANVTGQNVGRYLAIVLDGKVITAPVVKDRIFGDGIISGGFKEMKDAKELADLLNAGALPVPVTIMETRTVSATLGADSVSASLMAGLVGLIAVLIFMASYYRLPGLMANCALVIYIFLSLLMLKVFDATLTLPGIAGIIISIGMAVDANVIIFERLKEELRMQKPLETAIDVAFSRAWTAILDSNIASILTGSVLWALGTGAVRGFAITLIIGVVVSLFTAVTVTRLFMKLMIRSKAGHNMAWYGV